MKYYNNSNLNDNQIKALAYVMTVEMKRPQTAAAAFFGVSQGTISNWVKEARFLLQIGQLKAEVDYYRNNFPGGAGGLPTQNNNILPHL